MPKRIVLFANGQPQNLEMILNWLQPDDYILCADGGAQHTLSLGLLPDLIVGDLDSLDPATVAALEVKGCKFVRHPADKDATDLELALEAAQRLGAEQVVLVTALGGRLDQTLANLMLLAAPEFAKMDLRLRDGQQTAWVVRDRKAIPGKPGDIVSALALTPVVTGLTYHEGLRWPLRDFTLRFGSSRAISNEMTAERADISLSNGILLLVHIAQGE